MEYAVKILEKFDGQISLTDIFSLTRKELTYLEKYRDKLISSRGGNNSKAFEKLLKK